MATNEEITINNEQISIQIITNNDEYDMFKVGANLRFAIVDILTIDDNTEDNAEIGHQIPIEAIVMLTSNLKGTVIYMPSNENIEYVITELQNEKVYVLDNEALEVFNQEFNCDLKCKCILDYADIDFEGYGKLFHYEEKKCSEDDDEYEQFVCDLPGIFFDSYCAVFDNREKVMTKLKRSQQEEEESHQLFQKRRKMQWKKPDGWKKRWGAHNNIIEIAPESKSRNSRSEPEGRTQECVIEISEPEAAERERHTITIEKEHFRNIAPIDAEKRKLFDKNERFFAKYQFGAFCREGSVKDACEIGYENARKMEIDGKQYLAMFSNERFDWSKFSSGFGESIFVNRADFVGNKSK